MAKNHKTKLVRAFKRNGKVIVDIPVVKTQKFTSKPGKHEGE